MGRGKRVPFEPVQVLFNAACLTVCTATAFAASHYVLAMLRLNSLSALMVLGSAVYVVLNTGLVSLVMSLTDQPPFASFGASCYEWTFPYFLVGAAVAGLGNSCRFFVAARGNWLICSS